MALAKLVESSAADGIRVVVLMLRGNGKRYVALERKGRRISAVEKLAADQLAEVASVTSPRVSRSVVQFSEQRPAVE